MKPWQVLAWIVGSPVLFGTAGTGIGLLLGRYAPGFYHASYSRLAQQGIDPVEVGVGLGLVQGAIAGLVAVTPAAGTSGFAGAALLGAAAALGCYWFVGRIKNRLKLDDALDAFGIHGIGGLVGSIGTAIVSAPALGGFGAAGYDLSHRLAVQVEAVLVAVGWSAAGSALCFAIAAKAIGLRVTRDEEREGLDLADHGERAYNP